MATLAAYYQCYKNEKAFGWTLASFRWFYPQNEIVLVSDGGDDFSEAARKFGCQYFPQKKLDTKINLVFNTIEALIEFVFRIKRYTEKVDAQYLLLLEDDVRVLNKITEKDLVSDINGCNYNEFFNQEHEWNLKQRNKSLDFGQQIFFGGCGGSVLNLKFFKLIFENEEELVLDIREFWDGCGPLEVASDRCLSYLCLKNGGTIGQYPGFCETWYPDYKERVDKNNIEVLHQLKIGYDKNE